MYHYPTLEVMSSPKDLEPIQGTGLGLVSAKCLAELYRGSLTIENIHNQHTTVTVMIAIQQ